MPSDALKLISEFIIDPLRIEEKKDELSLELIAQYYIQIEKDEYKLATLSVLLENSKISQAIIYLNTNKGVESLSKLMIEKNYSVSILNSGIEEAQRKIILKEFLSGLTRILITTYLSGRENKGKHVSLVINFDMPSNCDNYFYRMARSTSSGIKGVAINFVLENENHVLKDIEERYKMSIKQVPEDIGSLFD